MAKQPRNIYDPITARDWFLFHLFNDAGFLEIRKQWQLEINDLDQEPGQKLKQREAIEKITTHYIKPLRENYRISEEIARKGLLYKKYSRIINRDRMPVARIEHDRVIISVGVDTKLEDIEGLWGPWISYLQSKLPSQSTKRESPSEEPLLAYTVYKELLKGRALADIHQAYLTGTLDTAIPEGAKWLDVNDFRKYYDSVVKGYLDHA